ncbi:hypothetical protein COOONC_17297 [Cooperia oncophora]
MTRKRKSRQPTPESGDLDKLLQRNHADASRGISGDVKAKAKEELKAACKHYGKELMGEDNLKIITEMKDSGATQEAISQKVDEIVEEISDSEKKAKAKRFTAACKKIYGSARRRRDHHEHNIEEGMQKFLTWMTDDQKAKVKATYESGDRQAFYKEIMQMFEASSGDVKMKAKEELKAACKHYGKELMGEDNLKIITEMKDSGATQEAISQKKVDEIVEEISDSEKKAKAKRFTAACKKIYGSARRRRERQHRAGKYRRRHAKKAKVKATYESGDRQAFYREIMQMFEDSTGDVKAKAKEELKAACKHYGKELMGEDNLKIITEMKDSGATQEAISQKVDEIVEEISDSEKKAKAKRFTAACKKIYGSARRRRDHHEHNIEEGMQKYLSWLTDDQKAKVKATYESGDREAFYKEIMQMFEASSGDVKMKAKEELKAACKHYGEDLMGEDKIKMITEMKDSGATNEAILKKIDEIARAKRLTMACKKIYAPARRRRDHHHPVTLEEALTKYLTWLSDDQKEELKSLKESGDKEGIYKKVMEYFEGVSGEKKEKASEELQSGCRHYIREILGAEKADQFRAMKESARLPRKIEEAIEELTDEEVKSRAKKASVACKRIFGVAHRFRRDHHPVTLEEALTKYLTWLSDEQKEELKSMKESGDKEGIYKKVMERDHHPVTLEEALTKYLTWLTDEQKEELKSMKESGDKEGIYKKVMEYFEGITGEKKEKATEELRAACKHYLREILGNEKADEFRSMKESGTPEEEIAKKVEEAIEGLTDESAKSRGKKASAACKRIFGVSRYLTWLTDEQKEELKSMKESGDKEGIYKKVMEYFEGITGEKKEKATEELRAACKHYLREILGNEKADEFRSMKESGTPEEEIAKKVEEAIEGLTDESAKSRGKKASAACKRIFGVARRFRRDHHPVTLEEALTKYLTWLSDEQKEELKSMKESGDKEGIYKKVMEYFEGITGEKKEKATEELRAACKHYLREILGNEKADEFRSMKESGTPEEEIAKKVENGRIEGLTDESAKSRGKKASAACKRIFGVARRFRRDHREHTLGHALDNYLTWLTEDQKEQVKELYEEGGRGAVYDRIMEYFDDATGETKKKAAMELKGACRHYVKDLIGEKNGEVIRDMKENGASNDEIATKVEEMIEAIADDKKKAQALRASANCRKIYGVARRFRRGHKEDSIDDIIDKYLKSWLDDDQKEEVKKLHEAGDHEGMYSKVMGLYDSTTGDLKEKATAGMQAACRYYMRVLIGDEKADELKEMKESGASHSTIAANLEEFIASMTDEGTNRRKPKRNDSQILVRGFSVRDQQHEQSLEEAMEKYLSWMNEDQKKEIDRLYDSGDKQTMYKKVMEFYDSASGDVKEKATTLLGEEKADELKKLKESGASHDAIAAKVEEFIAAITDEKKKAQAERVSVACKKVYGVARRFKRDHEHSWEEAKEKYLTWLDEDQMEEVKKLHDSGDKEAIDRERRKATLANGQPCKHYVKDTIGEENAEKLKEMKEGGATPEAIAAKVEEFIAAITDAGKESEGRASCNGLQEIYGVARRFRREHHEHNLEEAMEKYLSWLRDDQKAEVKKIYATGDRVAVEKKVLEMFEDATGDVKGQKAAAQMRAACKHYIKEYIGDENVAKIKQMRDSGATNEELSAKIDELRGDN